MRIQELLEAVAPIGSTTNAVSPDGLPKTTAPAPAPQTPAVPGQPVAPAPAPGQPVAPAAPGAAPGAAPAPTLGNQSPAGQPMGQPPAALQQGMKSTMTDLDKIAAQIVGLKQKQQQMQQQMQPTP